MCKLVMGRRSTMRRAWVAIAVGCVTLTLGACGQSPASMDGTMSTVTPEPALAALERRLTPRTSTASIGVTTASVSDSGFEVVDVIGAPPTGPGEFNVAASVAVSADGIVYVTDHFNDRVQRFAADGTFLGAWGSPGTGPGEFDGPEGIAVGSDGQVFVIDRLNGRVHGRVQRFDATGAYLGEWGHIGYGAGIAVGPTGAVYVLDTSGDRVQRFTADGTFELAWSAGGQWWEGVAVAPTTGEIFVTDSREDRVHVFDPDGNLLRSWGSPGPNAGELQFPTGIAVTSDGRVYVLDGNRVQQFSVDGVFVGQWGAFGFDEGRFNTPRGVAVAANGDVVVADSWNHRVQVFDSDGTFVRLWGNELHASGRFNLPDAVALAPSGRLYVAEPRRDRVQAFDAQGALAAQLEGDCAREGDWIWGDSCRGPGQFAFPWALGVDEDERVFLLNANFGRVQRFGPGLDFELSWGEDWRPTNRSAPFRAQDFRAKDLATTSDGRIAVLGDALNPPGPEVRQFDGAGSEQGRWPLAFSPFSVWRFAAGLSGSVHLGVETYPDCSIAVVDAAGHQLREWHAATAAEDDPFGCGFGDLAVDAYGNTYATIGDEVLVFDRYGRERTRWGGTGTVPGQFRVTLGVDVGTDGTVVVADGMNHRVQLFAPRVRYAFGGFAPPIGAESTTVKAGRSVPVSFDLGGDQGPDVVWSIDSDAIDCVESSSLGDLESIATVGSSDVVFDADTQSYGVNWKTDRSWSGTCRELVLMLADFSVHTVKFVFE